MSNIETNLQRLGTYFISWITLLAIIAPMTAVAQLEEIVVTARKHEVSLQDAAVAVSVITGADFDKSNVVKLDNFNGYVPGLNVSKNDGAGRVVTNSWYRLGNRSESCLATQRADLYRRYLFGKLSVHGPGSWRTWNGLKVFRGPQGTEFGQGTTGGAY